MRQFHSLFIITERNCAMVVGFSAKYDFSGTGTESFLYLFHSFRAYGDLRFHGKMCLRYIGQMYWMVFKIMGLLNEFLFQYGGQFCSCLLSQFIKYASWNHAFIIFQMHGSQGKRGVSKTPQLFFRLFPGGYPFKGFLTRSRGFQRDHMVIPVGHQQLKWSIRHSIYSKIHHPFSLRMSQ